MDVMDVMAGRGRTDFCVGQLKRHRGVRDNSIKVAKTLLRN